jgi:hypothetical protein
MSTGLELLCSKDWKFLQSHGKERPQGWRLLNKKSVITKDAKTQKSRSITTVDCDEDCAATLQLAWSQFQEHVVVNQLLASAVKKWERIGGQPEKKNMGDDGGKMMATDHLAMFQQRAAQKQIGCVVYSFGSNGDISFERALFDRTDCSIFIFDCTLSPHNIQLVQRRLQGADISILPWCVGGGAKLEIGGETIHGGLRPRFSIQEMMIMLKHSNIDVIKIDVELAEYNVLASLLNDFGMQTKSEKQTILPQSILVELHAPAGPKANIPVKLFMDGMGSLGYVLIFKEFNKLCGDCIELHFVQSA